MNGGIASVVISGLALCIVSKSYYTQQLQR